MAQIKRNFAQFDLSSDSEDDDQEATKLFRRKKNCTLFCIDARKPMFVASGGEEYPFTQCLKCIRSAIRNKIFSSERCACGVILLGTDSKDNHLSLDNLTVIQPLQDVGAEHIQKIDAVSQAVNDSSYEGKFGHATFNVGDAFWLAERIFSDKFSNSNKNIILFTNDDNPHGQNPLQRRRALETASDMALNSVTVDLIHLGTTFDVNKFYKETLQLSRNDPSYVIPDPVTKMAEMFIRVTKKNFRHVSMVKIPFIIANNFKCGVSVHHLVREVNIPHKVKLSKETNEKVVSKLELFKADTGEKVDKTDLQKVFTVAQEQIPLTFPELKESYGVEERCLRLMGFKPASTIKIENYIKPCAFIYPDESQFKGSTTFLAALLKKCQDRGKVAICTYLPRPKSSVRFVALVPQEELLSDNKTQLRPPGFNLVFLPYAEEVRDVDEKCCGRKRATPEQVDVARSVIKKLRFRYSPECFDNPKLRMHWAGIEALALDLAEPEKIVDNTVPDYERIEQKLGELAQKFTEQLFPLGYVPGEPRGKSRAKKTTVLDIVAVQNAFDSGRANQLTTDVLKAYLQAVGKDKGLSKLKKADLVARVSQHLGEN